MEAAGFSFEITGAFAGAMGSLESDGSDSVFLTVVFGAGGGAEGRLAILGMPVDETTSAVLIFGSGAGATLGVLGALAAFLAGAATTALATGAGAFALGAGAGTLAGSGFLTGAGFLAGAAFLATTTFLVLTADAFLTGGLALAAGFLGADFETAFLGAGLEDFGKGFLETAGFPAGLALDFALDGLDLLLLTV